MRPYEQRFVWNLDWNLLRTFMVMVEQGGITPAATFPGLKQPTLSSALKRLEAQVGKRRVNRSSTHFSVTRWARCFIARPARFSERSCNCLSC
ncbi:MAG: LysR family transcriptional regulator [Rhodobacterales bacterium]|nr:LysR family transcriptional regulator [Rhodobacterales bacterium]